jgi:hypothetical protein
MMRSRRKAPKANAGKPSGPPGFVKAIIKFPLLAHLAGRLIGLGFRREKLK